MSGMIPGKFSVTLPDCSAAKLRKLDVSFVLTMPRGNAFALVQSYEDATLPDLDGNVTLNLYECDLTAGNLPNCNQINPLARAGRGRNVFHDYAVVPGRNELLVYVVHHIIHRRAIKHDRSTANHTLRSLCEAAKTDRPCRPRPHSPACRAE